MKRIWNNDARGAPLVPIYRIVCRLEVTDVISIFDWNERQVHAQLGIFSHEKCILGEYIVHHFLLRLQDIAHVVYVVRSDAFCGLPKGSADGFAILVKHHLEVLFHFAIVS